MAAPGAAQAAAASNVAFVGQDGLHDPEGARLCAPWQVPRQGSANICRFGLCQPGDERDPAFADADNRAAMVCRAWRAGAPSRRTPRAASWPGRGWWS